MTKSVKVINVTRDGILKSGQETLYCYGVMCNIDLKGINRTTLLRCLEHAIAEALELEKSTTL